jgi:protein-L-isoaspartate(D-aspartate) O-methyltransferase
MIETELLKDTYRHKGLRNRLVSELEEKGLTDKQVLEWIRAVPRHYFFPDQAFVEKAYQDIAFKIGSGQTISHPSTVAFQTMLLKPAKGEKILEIGTGSGYQTAVLLQSEAKVFSIERQHDLFVRTKRLFESLGLNPRLSFGDGYLGYPAYAPFHKILVTAGAPFIPQALVEQLMPGGRLVIPVGADGAQEMIVVDKSSSGEIKESRHGEFKFVPLLENRN